VVQTRVKHDMREPMSQFNIPT